MKLGKLSENILRRAVLTPLEQRRQEVCLRPAFGEDCAAVLLRQGDRGLADRETAVVLSSDTSTVTKENLGVFVLNTVVNDLAAGGAEPIGIMVNLMVPARTRERFVRLLMEDLEKHCKAFGMEILGGHTEVSEAVSQPVLTVTGLGNGIAGNLQSAAHLHVGDELVMTKWAAIQGTVKLATEQRAVLEERLPKELLDKAAEHRSHLSVLHDAAIANQMGASALHNLSQGGVFGALWEFGAASDVGFTVDLHKIPICQETVELCEVFDLNPYKLLSGGSLLIGCANGNRMVQALQAEGIAAAVIGNVTGGRERIIMNGEETRYLERGGCDEIFKL